MTTQPDVQDPFALLINMRDGGESIACNVLVNYVNEIELIKEELGSDFSSDNDDEDDDNEDNDDVEKESTSETDSEQDNNLLKRKRNIETKQNVKKIRIQKPKKTKVLNSSPGAIKNELLTFEEQQEIEEPVEIDLRNVYKAYGINPIEVNRQKLFRKQSNDILNFSIGEAFLKFVHGKNEEAISLLFEVIRINPLNSEPYDALGELYRRMGNYQKALEFYLLGIEFNQNDSERWIQVAEIAEMNGMLKSAVEFYTRGIKLRTASRTSTTSCYIKKCNLLEQMNQYENAFKTYEKLLCNLEQSNDSDYKVRLSIVFRIATIQNLHMNKSKDALDFVERQLKHYQIESDRDRFTSFANFYIDSYLDLLLKCGQYLKVLFKFFQYNLIRMDQCSLPTSEEVNEEVLIEIITSKPNSFVFYNPDSESDGDSYLPKVNIVLKSKFVCVFIYLHKFSFIEPYCQEFKSLTDVSSQETVYPSLVEAFIHVEEYEWAYQFVSKLVTINQNSSRYWYWYGLCHSKINKLDELEDAIKAFERAIHLDRNNYDAMNELSNICNLIGNPERALDNVNLMEQNLTVVDFKLLYNRCSLLYICKRWEEFISASHMLLGSEMHFFPNKVSINEIIHPNLCRSSLLKLSRRLTREYAKQSILTKLSGGKLTSEQVFDLWKKNVFVMLNYTKQHNEAIRFAFSAMLYPHFKHLFIPFVLCIFRCCLDTKSKKFTYELARFLLKEYPQSGKLWYAFSLAMNDIYRDFRHKRFCMRIWKTNPENINILMMNGHIALLNGRYRHALAIFLLVYRYNSNFRYDSFYIGLCYLHLMMQNHTLDKCSLFAQMLSFFYDYINKIGKCQESYYNLGRVCHQLGFYMDAVYLYKLALKTSLKIHDKRFDLTPEIAFNLSQIYRFYGEHKQANKLIIQYCTI